jgi:hypothetical protein
MYLKQGHKSSPLGGTALVALVSGRFGELNGLHPEPMSGRLAQRRDEFKRECVVVTAGICPVTGTTCASDASAFVLDSEKDRSV